MQPANTVHLCTRHEAESHCPHRYPQPQHERAHRRVELAKGSAALVSCLRTALVAMLAAIGAGVALVYTARTYRLTRRGQITDRFNKALERLGSEREYVRIGGVLNLEQIVQDAPEQAAPDAARVLVHFIRNRAPKAQHSRRKWMARMRGGDNTSLPLEPAADVQAALTALTSDVMRLHADPRVVVLDLHGLHLARSRASMIGLHFRRTCGPRKDSLPLLRSHLIW